MGRRAWIWCGFWGVSVEGVCGARGEGGGQGGVSWGSWCVLFITLFGSKEMMLTLRPDAALQKELSQIPQATSYTLIYLTTAPPSSHPVSPSTSTSTSEENIYQPSFENDAVHMDLKRNLAPPARGKGPFSDQRPLFEQYQFLTPGLFMGLLVGLILFAILSVGISAISGLKVSYAAFEKEMGPGAQKKVQ